MKQRSLLILLLSLLPFLSFGKSYLSFGDALKSVLPTGQKLFKEEITLDKTQAKYLNKKYESDYRKNEKMTIYFTKDDQENITGYAIVLEDILWEYVAYHKWAIGYKPDGTINGIGIISLTDEYTFEMPDPRFLGQFKDKLPKDIKMPGNVDAMTGATMSSELLLSTTFKAWEIIQYLNN